ncbi:hypothetical protein DM02DRAFT_655372 [Periconia macrospinosa]|uniref:Uncharacterized protein n=1 Tax=Periconia macrospinosa TaxID=97972 RepID=A0A2V1DUH6_9PLEO|nr:hypothetical protein DM02DRAFT_655372 [Periconia macrospinosa]
MFNFGGALLAGQHDNQKERPPPSRPTPVTFPALVPPEPSPTASPPAWTSGSSTGVSTHFLNLRKPSDITVDTLSILNVTFRPQCDFETLLSSSNDAQSHLPPKTWLEPPTQEQVDGSAPDATVKLLSSGRRVPDRNEFYSRAKELLFANEDAFSNLTRKPRGDRVPLRLAHFRKFWEGLDNVAYYWDTSLDEYLPPKPQSAPDSDGATPSDVNQNIDSSNNQPAVDSQATEEVKSFSQPHQISPREEEPRKKAKTEATSDETTAQSIGSAETTSAASFTPTTSISSSRALPARTVPPKLPWAPDADSQPRAQASNDLSKGSYKGYRVGNGAEMPIRYQNDCVRAFLEPITWAFGVTVAPHRRPPVLVMEHVRFPVRMTTAAWRMPQDRIKARQGWMEGPVMGVQCRQETSFGSTGDLQAESVLDATRELGGLLLLAQERAREGKTEVRGGEGKWWTSKHRWGGGPGGEVGEATGASDATPEVETPKPEEKPTRTKLGSKERRRPTPAEVWKTIRPGNPLWDPKTVYEAIGKDRDSEWDEIFMISSLNHHISVIKLRVHRLYIEFITTGAIPEDTPSEQDWRSPQLQRTRWFNLFEVEDRKEAMRGIWGIMSYLVRVQGKDDIPMTDA